MSKITINSLAGILLVGSVITGPQRAEAKLQSKVTTEIVPTSTNCLVRFHVENISTDHEEMSEISFRRDFEKDGMSSIQILDAYNNPKEGWNTYIAHEVYPGQGVVDATRNYTCIYSNYLAIGDKLIVQAQMPREKFRGLKNEKAITLSDPYAPISSGSFEAPILVNDSDYDEDGLKDYQERLFGSDEFDADSRFVATITYTKRDGAKVLTNMPTTFSTNYSPQVKYTLMGGNDVSGPAQEITNAVNVAEFEVPTSEDASFYWLVADLSHNPLYPLPPDGTVLIPAHQ